MRHCMKNIIRWNVSAPRNGEQANYAMGIEDANAPLFKKPAGTTTRLWLPD